MPDERSDQPPAGRPNDFMEEAEPSRLSQIDEAPVDLGFLEGMREKARRQLAQFLVFILAGTIGLAFLGVGGIVIQASWLPPGTDSPRLAAETDLLLRLLELVFAPLVALVGGALGFYFATRERLPDR